MDFTFTEEQDQIRDSLRRFLTEAYTLERRREILRAGTGCDLEIWRQFAELGILGLGIPEALGGIGGSASGIPSPRIPRSANCRQISRSQPVPARVMSRRRSSV